MPIHFRQALLTFLVLAFTVLLSSADLGSQSANSLLRQYSSNLPPPGLPIPSLKESLIKKLMAHYRRYERPTEGQGEPTEVRVSIKILAITSVDVINMQYTADMVLVQRWNDPRLRWEHLPEFSAISENILFTQRRNEIWLPDLFFRNGKEGFLYRMTVPNHMIRVSPNGDIYYSQKITMKLACEMHLRNFPMDQQDCDMDIGSYGYTIDQLKFIWDGDNALKFADDMQISEFNTPSETFTEDCTEPQTTSTGTYTCLLGRFQLKRQIGSYLVGTYIPAFLIVIVSWLTFWVSTDAIPARVTLGLLTLISLLTNIASLNNTLPRVSYIKAIDIWLVACLLFVIAAMLEFTLVNYWSRRVFLAKWRDQIRRGVREALARVVCPCRTPKSHKLLLRCTCCGLINPQRQTAQNCSPMKTKKRRDVGRCACVPSSCCALKSDTPECQSNFFDCDQVSRSAVMPSTCQTVEGNSVQRSARHRQTLDENYFSNPAPTVVVSSPLSHPRNHRKNHPTRSSNIQMSSLQPRRKHKVKFSNSIHHGDFDKHHALCDRHPLPERYLKVREVEVDDEEVKTSVDGDLTSEIDAYSRFLFPCFFILYNCGYWGVYLIISDPGIMS
uniref:Ig-like domain-containing protein n=1 Tax=Mesocestoides corti TaxID=53468 RepID=A0A5K3F8G5_MESCO